MNGRLQAKRPSLNLGAVKFAGDAGHVQAEPAFFSYYVLGKKLGFGTTSVVKRAVRVRDNAEVAVKCISSHDEEMRRFAMEEYELLRELQHPNIVRAEAIHIADSHLWVVMELCNRSSLEQFVARNQPFSEVEIRPFFHQLLQAVHYLHKKRIVHRDLKPDNILLSGEDEQHPALGVSSDAVRSLPATLKISDFNSAKRIGDGQGSSAMLSFRGTRLYSAPELLLGKVWNERVDIWACGLCLHYAVLAELPFDCTLESNKLCFSAGVLPEMRFEGFSSQFRFMLEECLCVEMRDRPPAMELLRHDFFKDTEVQEVLRSTSRLSFSGPSGGSGSSSATKDPFRELQKSKYERSLREHHPTVGADFAGRGEEDEDDQPPPISQLRRSLFHTWSPDRVASSDTLCGFSPPSTATFGQEPGDIPTTTI